MRRWRRAGRARLRDCRVFQLDEVRYAPPEGGEERAFYVLDMPDWINVVALTERERILLVQQFRFGIDAPTLEIPGGLIDPGETPLVAARRELREETGAIADEWHELGWVHPNPPLQNNRCHTFLACGVRTVGGIQPDANERIEVVDVERRELPQLVKQGRITHALVLAAFHLFEAWEVSRA